MLPTDTRRPRGSTGYTPSSFLPQYLRRLFNYPQMDLEYTATQMVHLLVSPARVYKLTSLRKQTKNQWARDDPAFVAVQCVFLLVASVAYGVAFRVSGFGAWVWLLSEAFGQYLLVGAVVATASWAFANRYLRVHHAHSVEQEVEWAYAFDVHCNAFFPLFVLLYPVQYLLLPLLLRDAFVATLVGNTLYLAAFVAYHYIHFLGYMALPFLQRTQVFLYPVVAVAAMYLVCVVAQWSMPRMMLSLLLG